MKVTDEMVMRFLGWPLPKDFAPDCGIAFDGRKDDEWNKNKTWPVGTNLLTATQARAMLEHVLALPAVQPHVKTAADTSRDGFAFPEGLGLLSERETIARQAMKLEAIETEVVRLRENIKNAISLIVCIGGPLNDNKLGYSKLQMVSFQRIKEEFEAERSR